MRFPNANKLLKPYLRLSSVILCFWWPLSHWLYPAWYHGLMGFAVYDDAMVKVIGTLSLIPILCLWLAATDPSKNKGLLVILMLAGVLMALTYVFLIVTRAFPAAEYFNVVLLLANSLILWILFPRENAAASAKL